MNRIFYVLAISVVVSIGVAPVFAQTPQQYTVKDAQSGQSFTVNYNMSAGTIDDISISPKDSSLIISAKTTSDGDLTLVMPRALIDAKSGSGDDQFFVLVDGVDTEFTEKKTDTDRTITASIPEGTQQVEVIGTQVVPEFGGLSYVVLMIAIISIVAISAKTRLRIGH